jgi:hypothetical protein
MTKYRPKTKDTAVLVRYVCPAVKNVVLLCFVLLELYVVPTKVSLIVVCFGFVVAKSICIYIYICIYTNSIYQPLLTY